MTLKGLEYPLENETLEMGTARGVSNVLKEKQQVSELNPDCCWSSGPGTDPRIERKIS